MKSKYKKFSIVIPTYTGQDHLSDCFDSIINQDNLIEYDFDIVVVIDGPNDCLKKITAEGSKRFKKLGVDLSVQQFKKNKGRFHARQAGARMSSRDYILFLDDRAQLAKDYLNELSKANKKALIPSVLESSHPNFISKTLYYIRKKIYGKNWGNDFKSYFITDKNFEKSSKGTGSFWIERKLFIEACDEIINNQTNLKSVSDDTKLLKYILKTGNNIYRSNEAKIYYQPRASAIEEIKHIYKRGPIFIDYYLRPKTRFFVPLLLFYLSIITGLILLFVAPLILLFLLCAILLMVLILSFYFVGLNVDSFVIFFGFIWVSVAFGVGLIKGIIWKFIAKIGSWQNG